MSPALPIELAALIVAKVTARLIGGVAGCQSGEFCLLRGRCCRECFVSGSRAAVGRFSGLMNARSRQVEQPRSNRGPHGTINRLLAAQTAAGRRPTSRGFSITSPAGTSEEEAHEPRKENQERYAERLGSTRRRDGKLLVALRAGQ